jgi:xanthosine utilization system XapX-like protein
MPDRLPSGVLLEQTPDGARYLLPRLPAARRWPLGIALVLCGIAAMGAGVLAGVHLAVRWVDADPGPVLSVLLGLVAILMLGAGYALVDRGWRLLAGRSIVEIDGRRIWIGDEWGGHRSGRASPAHARLVSVDLARSRDGADQLEFTFTGGGILVAGRGRPGAFLRLFRDELRERHVGRQARPVPRPPPSASPPSPRPVEPSPPPPPPRPKGDTGITFLTEPTGASKGECQVCSTPMTADLVACAKCGTLHHRSCWDYVGRCSTYACGCTRSATVGSEGAPEEVVEIRGGPGGTIPNSFLRQWMKEVAAERGWGEIRSLEKKHRHLELDFTVGRLRCALVGRKQGNHLEFRMRVALPSAEDRVGAEAVLALHRNPSLRRSMEDGRLELRPATTIGGPRRLRSFVADALEVVGDLARRP